MVAKLATQSRHTGSNKVRNVSREGYVTVGKVKCFSKTSDIARESSVNTAQTAVVFFLAWWLSQLPSAVSRQSWLP